MSQVDVRGGNDLGAERSLQRAVRVAVVCLRRVSTDTAGRTYLTELLGPLGARPELDVTAHVADPDFAVPHTCREVRHRLRPQRTAAVAAELRLAAALDAGSVDVLLAPLNVLPPTWRGASVVVQHNVLGFENRAPLDVRLPKRLYRYLATRASILRADETLAISAYLRSRLLARFPGVDPRRVHVVPYGVSSVLLATPEPAVRPLQPHILVVSALRRYKRIGRAVEALAALPTRLGARLVVAGPGQASRRAELLGLAARLGVADRVRLAGNVGHAELGRLYRSAAVVLALSDVEASSLPILEAMALGVPVVASRIPGQEEIGGDVPLWVDAGASARDVAAALERVLTESAVGRERAVAGIERAAEFTWERTAARTAAALVRAAERSRATSA